MVSRARDCATIDPRYRPLVLMAGFGSLRWGELTALRRCDIDLEADAVRITRQPNEVSGRLAFGPPSLRQAATWCASLKACLAVFTFGTRRW
jgi:integrase